MAASKYSKGYLRYTYFFVHSPNSLYAVPKTSLPDHTSPLQAAWVAEISVAKKLMEEIDWCRVGGSKADGRSKDLEEVNNHEEEGVSC